MRNRTLCILTSLALLCFSCEEENPGQTSCDQYTIISEREFENAPMDQVSISEMEINGNCLNIEFTSSGCDGSTWKVELIDSEAIAESNPPQRRLILSLENQEPCDAVISKTMSFDIESLQVAGPSVWLVIINTDSRILYEY